MRYRDSPVVKAFRESASPGVKVKGSDAHLAGVRACLESRGGSGATVGCVNKATTKRGRQGVRRQRSQDASGSPAARVSPEVPVSALKRHPHFCDCSRCLGCHRG